MEDGALSEEVTCSMVRYLQVEEALRCGWDLGRPADHEVPRTSGKVPTHPGEQRQRRPRPHGPCREIGDGSHASPDHVRRLIRERDGPSGSAAQRLCNSIWFGFITQPIGGALPLTGLQPAYSGLVPPPRGSLDTSAAAVNPGAAFKHAARRYGSWRSNLGGFRSKPRRDRASDVITQEPARAHSPPSAREYTEPLSLARPPARSLTLRSPSTCVTESTLTPRVRDLRTTDVGSPSARAGLDPAAPDQRLPPPPFRSRHTRTHACVMSNRCCRCSSLGSTVAVGPERGGQRSTIRGVCLAGAAWKREKACAWQRGDAPRSEVERVSVTLS
ncbi:hypothetical protein AAFF_G00317350 [Aldrovandia affinis]|uniref:Uncharacterized protein n=1 Tax=Aldrovandia affinis TaxID=143900 RepID=A0AAD7R7G3_9TELE|nr:hypothetical protein AAFF_G00317350 [Aldrovandia affinis]